MSNNKRKAFAAYIMLCLIWSSTWLFIKLGLETMPPFLSAGIRFVLAALLLFLFSLKFNLKFPSTRKDHIFFIWFGLLLFTVPYGLVYWSEQYINSGLTAVLYAVMPFYTALLATKLLPSENVTARKMFGIVLGISGVVVIFSDQLQLVNPLSIYGMLAILISAVFSALGTLIGKKMAQHYHPVILNTLPIFYAGIAFLVASYFLESAGSIQFTNMAIFSILYLALFGTAIAFVLYFWLLKQTSAILMSSITFITPPLAVVWGWLTYNEMITIKLVLGMIVILTGIYFVSEKKELNPAG